MAKAGADRLKSDLSDFEVHVMNTKEFVPAPAQGVLAFQIREGDTRMQEVVSKLNHPDVAHNINVERTVLNKMDVRQEVSHIKVKFLRNMTVKLNRSMAHYIVLCVLFVYYYNYYHY